MFHRTPSCLTPCASCGKSPTSITLFTSTPTSAAGAMLCRSCATLSVIPSRKPGLAAVAEETHTIGGPPPSITSSLWAGKVPHLRAFAARAAQVHFTETNGTFFRDAMPKYLQDRVMKVRPPGLFMAVCICVCLIVAGREPGDGWGVYG